MRPNTYPQQTEKHQAHNQSVRQDEGIVEKRSQSSFERQRVGFHALALASVCAACVCRGGEAVRLAGRADVQPRPVLMSCACRTCVWERE